MTSERALPRILAACFLAAALAGCGGQNYEPPPAADPAVAKAALEKALESWRLQISPEELRDANPPIVAADFDWRDGHRLTQYELLPGEEAAGPTMRWPVRLRLVKGDGREETVDVLYVISTSPAIHIGRADY